MVDDVKTTTNDYNNDLHNYIVIKMPYFGLISLCLKRKLNKILNRLHNKKIKIVFTIVPLRSMFTIKSKSNTHLLSSVVYKFQCPGDPETSYIGETGRQLIRRIIDHRNSNTAITGHIHGCTFCPTHLETFAKCFTIMNKCSDYFDRNIKEALLIRRHRPTLNVQQTSGKQSFALQLFN